jgi:hypothetical protein
MLKLSGKSSLNIMKFDIALASFLLGAIASASGWVLWWITKIQNDKFQAIQKSTEAATKEYAAQRDFEHLKNNQLNISKGIVEGFNDMEQELNALHDELLEIKAYLIRYGGIEFERINKRENKE